MNRVGTSGSASGTEIPGRTTSCVVTSVMLTDCPLGRTSESRHNCVLAPYNCSNVLQSWQDQAKCRAGMMATCHVTASVFNEIVDLDCPMFVVAQVQLYCLLDYCRFVVVVTKDVAASSALE